MKKALLSAIAVLLLLFVHDGPAYAGGILDDIVKNGELVVGITGEQPPFNATDKNGEIIGFDAELARIIAEKMHVNVRFSKMPFTDLIPALQAGKVDMIASGMTMTLERNSKVAFIGPYFISGKGILLKSMTVETLKKEGLNSEKFKVVTLKGSTSQTIIEHSAPNASLILADSYDDALQLLFQDKADIVIADFPFCAYIADRYPEKELAVGETRLSFEPLGLAVRADVLLINGLDNFLKTFVLSGDMQKLQDKWLKSRVWFEQLP